MKKRGKYIIHWGSASHRTWGGPSYLSGNGERPPTIKEVLSNELYMGNKAPYTWFSQWWGLISDRLNCDWGGDDPLVPGVVIPEEYFTTGIPYVKAKDIISSVQLTYECFPVFEPDMELWSGYKTLNFKRFLMSRGFDVEIYDYNDLIDLGVEDAINLNRHEDAIEEFHSRYQELTGGDPGEVEYVLIVSNSHSQGQMQSLPDEANYYPEHSYKPIIEPDRFYGANEDSQTNVNDGFLGEFLPQEGDPDNLKVPDAIVGRWNVSRLDQAMYLYQYIKTYQI